MERSRKYIDQLFLIQAILSEILSGPPVVLSHLEVNEIHVLFDDIIQIGGSDRDVGVLDILYRLRRLSFQALWVAALALQVLRILFVPVYLLDYAILGRYLKFHVL